MAAIAGIVLAAGSATRMGEPKQLLPYRGSTLLNVVIASAEASRLDHVVVVTGANAEEVGASLVTERATVIFNPDFHRASHPFLLSRAALDEAAKVEGPKVLWRMLSYDDSGRVARVTVAQTAPRDINTPQDYEAFLADG